MSRRYIICLHVDGALRNKSVSNCLEFKHADGTPLTEAEAEAHLVISKAKGYKVIPMSTHCDKPCAYVTCPGFDYAGGGCGGHDSAEEEPK